MTITTEYTYTKRSNRTNEWECVQFFIHKRAQMTLLLHCLEKKTFFLNRHRQWYLHELTLSDSLSTALLLFFSLMAWSKTFPCIVLNELSSGKSGSKKWEKKITIFSLSLRLSRVWKEMIDYFDSTRERGREGEQFVFTFDNLYVNVIGVI